MIWIDSSFAIEWLLGTERASKVMLTPEPLGILAAQYAEILSYFLRRTEDVTLIIEQLEALSLATPEKRELQFAARIYHQARQRNSKASLADAILAAVATMKGEQVLSFDQDFASLGLVEKNGVWSGH